MTNIRFLLLLSILAIVTLAAPAQQMRIIQSGPGGKTKIMKGDLFDIPELGAMIVKSDSGNLKVEHVMPQEARSKAYADVDIKSGDEILLLNGKRVKTIKEIEEQYTSVAIGGEVKLGIQRGQEMLISRFAKADPKDLPKRKMMIINSDGPDSDIRPLPNLGVIMGKAKDGVVVKELLDNAVKPLTDAGVKAGDKLVSINGKEIKSMDDFTKEFTAVSPGSTMTWVVAHNGKNVSLSLVRPEPQGQVIIRQEKK